ncbi:MAG: metal ABC transporter substrate-binding protein [Bacillota bacterium]|nr:metal ABC transporter substrate-binding protein [Thermoanaerobacteraceae bacterium]
MRVKILLFAAAVLWGLLLGGCSGSGETAFSPRSTGRLNVMATFYPLCDFTRKVGGERVAVTCLVPPGVSVHDWEPTPRDIARAVQADVLVYNGAGLEPWIEQILPEFKGAAVEATQGLTLLRFDAETHGHGETAGHGAYDPHAWLDPVCAVHYVKRITAALVEADPAGAEYYQKRAAAYISQLEELDTAYREAAAAFARREIVTSHAAFGYLAARYGLKQIPVAGLSPQAEPSPARLAELVGLVREHGVKYVFFETAASPRLAETLAQEAGVETLVLSPAAGLTPEERAGKKDYIAVMRDNLAALITALEGE